MTTLPKNLDDLIAYAYTQEFNNPLAYELARNLEAYRMKVMELVEVHNACSEQAIASMRQEGL